MVMAKVRRIVMARAQRIVMDLVDGHGKDSMDAHGEGSADEGINGWLNEERIILRMFKLMSIGYKMFQHPEMGP